MAVSCDSFIRSDEAVAFETGDEIRIMCDGRAVDGVIELVSKNEISMLVHFGTMLHGHVGTMPILRGEDGIYRSIIDGVEVHIRKRHKK
jgi:hypothetical protein